MRILCLFLLVIAVPALVTASLQTNNCIVGCKCREDDNAFVKKLKIVDCDSPLALTKSALANVSKNIKILSLKGVEIKVIEKDAFDGLNDLSTVVIEDSNIGSIDPSAFNLEQLSTISFTKTTFGEAPKISSQFLEELIFKDCKLTEVPNVDELPSLSFLNLANNSIETIDEMAFVNSKSLEEVTLANNSISKLPPNLFLNNVDFNVLNVDDNPLETFSLNLNSTLEFLSLKSCHLTVFDRNTAKSLNSLRNLELNGNQISILPLDAFAGMKSLSYIDLSNNQLVELDDDIFVENSNLIRINLDDNPLESLPKFQSNSASFKTEDFSCNNCGLKSVKNSFENMPNIETLDLSHNRLSDIEGVFTEIKSLQQLFLSHNNITTIGPNVFRKNINLQSLDFSNNPLEPLDPVVFAKIESLQKLDVSNCSLLQLWTNRDQALLSLEYLVLANNSITVISVDDVKIAPKLKLLDLRGNPIVCTQELHELLVYVKTNSIQPEENYILKTHEIQTSEFNMEDEFENPTSSLWRNLADVCGMESIFKDEEIDNNDLDIDTDGLGFQTEPTTKADDDDDLSYYFDEDYETDEGDKGEEVGQKDDLFLVGPSIMDDKNLSLARASYILSITSVFILTALVVLTIAVAVTLLILKRNKSFNMHNGNLPRLKIPLWHNTLGQKKHSGSVYKPLSEDYSGPRTPIINRYEFKQTPQVHNAIP